MPREVDLSSGEVGTNKAGAADHHDEETRPVDRPTEPVEEDAKANAEKTRVVYGKKWAVKDDQPRALSGEGTDEQYAIVPCVGWLVIWEGPGKGASLPLEPGLNTIGRDDDCDIVLSFGDESVSKEGKIGIGYEYQGHTFAFVNRGSKNPPYLNDRPIWTEAALQDGDKLKIGETTLIFISFCNQERNWS